MSHVIADRVKETTTTTGTGTVTLAGAVTGFRTFSSVMSTGDTCYYCIDDGAGAWEVGLGTLASSTTLSRTTLLSSSTGSAVSFAAGTKNVWIDGPASKLMLMPKSVYLLDWSPLHATMGDDFDGSSLNARWTRHNIVSGDETAQVIGSARGLKTATVSAGDAYYQTAPGGNFSLEASFIQTDVSVATFLVGAFVVDSSGNGIGAFWRAGNGVWMVNISAWAYSSYANGYSDTTVAYSQIAHLRLNKSGTSFTCQRGIGGELWSPASSASTWAGTPAYVGVGCAYIDSGSATVTWRRFNVV